MLKLYIALAKADAAKLGFDPTMTRIPSADGEKCRIEFEGRDLNKNRVKETYETVRCLSSIRADWIIGRATRVWEVQRIDPTTNKPDGTVKVLKDLWIDNNRDPEGEMYRQISRWIREHPESAGFEKYFFTFHADGDVKVNNEIVTTFENLRGCLVPRYGRKLEPKIFKVGEEPVLSYNTVNTESRASSGGFCEEEDCVCK